MASTLPRPAPKAPARVLHAARGGLGVGIAVGYLSLIVLIPLAALAAEGLKGGVGAWWDAITEPQTFAALRLTLMLAVVVSLVNVVMGVVIAWVLVRYRFPGRTVIDALVDLPFALPTIVAGLTLLALYGPSSPFGIDIAYTRFGIVCALLLVTLPFVVRTVQPLLREADREAEQAAASLGAGPFTIFRRIVLPGIRPGICAGTGLGFARALGEFGAVVLIAGNLPMKTETAPVNIFGLVETDQRQAAAAVSLALLMLSLATLVVFDLLERRSARGLG